MFLFGTQLSDGLPALRRTYKGSSSKPAERILSRTIQEWSKVFRASSPSALSSPLNGGHLCHRIIPGWPVLEKVIYC